MRIELVTIFPDFFTTPLRTGLLGKAIDRGIASFGTINPRDFAPGRHASVDDAPYGGGAGVVMRPEPLVRAIEATRRDGPAHVVLMTPRGKVLRQSDLQRFSALPKLVLVAGRYEGFDERVTKYADEEISIGDFILTGGEYAALVIVDGVVRLLEGTLGNETSKATESFSESLLEHAQYTRPEVFEGQEVPAVLSSGDHARIDQSRRSESLAVTRERRPDLLERARVFERDRWELQATPSRSDISLIVRTDAAHGVVDLVAAYGLAESWIVPVEESCEAVAEVLRKPKLRAPVRRGSRKEHEARMRTFTADQAALASASGRVHVVGSLEAALADAGTKFPNASFVYEGLNPETKFETVCTATFSDINHTVLLTGFGEEPRTQGVNVVARLVSPVTRRDAVVSAAVLVDRVVGER